MLKVSHCLIKKMEFVNVKTEKDNEPIVLIDTSGSTFYHKMPNDDLSDEDENKNKNEVEPKTVFDREMEVIYARFKSLGVEQFHLVF